MRIVIVALSALALGGCMTPGEEQVPTREDSRFECNAARIQNLVGQVASQAMGGEAVRASNSRSLRWISPGMAVTMDYRADRLNIHLDNQNRVTRIACG